MKRRAVFLDRDGVINRTVFWQGKMRAPATLADFNYFDGVLEAIQSLSAQNFLLIVVTNQPDVKRGWQTREVVEQMNQKVKDDLKVDAIRVCYHDEGDHCDCRKPKPGMLLAAAQEWNIDLSTSFLVGDRYSDIAAGNSAGCQSILVGEGDPTEIKHPQSIPVAQVSSLRSAAEWILKNVRSV
jgi:D-glycero-D-manno-heptose 1,7-bisphosphate phosphatase